MPTLVTNCPRCGAARTTFDVSSHNYVGWENIDWVMIFEVFGVCRHCNQASIFLLKLRSYEAHRNFQPGADGWRGNSHLNDHFEILRFISIQDTVRNQPPEHVPAEISAAFREGASCLSIDCFNAAGTMFRLALDLATRQFLPDPADQEAVQPNARQRRDLGLRLPWLFEQNRLPMALRGLAGCVREDGNDGAHAGLLSAEDAQDLLDFTAILLERLYTEPRRVELAEERRAIRRAPPHRD